MAVSAQSVAHDKYLTFLLGHEEYGVNILKVKEIIGLINITPVPETPPFVKGIINLRGKVIPVIDLRLKFQMPQRDYDERTCIVIMEIQRMGGESLLIGVIVDGVSEVLPISEEKIEPPPAIGLSLKSTYIKGMAKINDVVKILLDIDLVLSSDEVMSLVSEETVNGATG